MFLDPNWLPAHNECKIECNISSEICQISRNNDTKKNFAILKQRCFECKIFFLIIK